MAKLNFVDSVGELPELTALKGCKSVAVKLHMGEIGNPTHLSPDLVTTVVSKLPNECEPFLFDSPVAYKGGRATVEDYEQTAKDHGFDKVGIPIIISNDFVEYESKSFPIQVCKPLVEADAVLVLSHVKGHRAAGFGGAIKNMGMGCLTKETKGKIHGGAKAVYIKGCNLCGVCAKVCPFGAISYTDRPNFNNCFGCSVCVVNCPQKALKPKLDLFDILLAEGSATAYKSFKKSYFVNCLINITEMCDCWNKPSEILTPDIGFLTGPDPVAIDKASIDLINKQAGRDLFLEVNHKDPQLQIKASSRNGMGSLEYTLV